LPRCGYAWTGISTPRVRDPQTYYIYYRCISCASRSGEKAQPCGVPSVPAGRLEEAVWQDVCALLKHPHKIEEEYQRRLQSKPGQGWSRGIEPVTRIIAKLKRSISRLVDLYSEGLLEKHELEPRLRAAKERLSKLEAEEQQLAAQEAQQAELRLALTCLQDFAEQVQEGLERADWTTRRDAIRALVRRIEINDREVRIVYRVAPVPFVERPGGAFCKIVQRISPGFAQTVRKRGANQAQNKQQVHIQTWRVGKSDKIGASRKRRGSRQQTDRKR
jgi:site-specific DNA recombinase